MIGAAISALGNIASSAINARSQKKTNQANIDLWREQAAYNHPAAMRSRLTQAGMNPNLAYGNPTSSGLAGTPPKMDPVKVDNPLQGINPLVMEQSRQIRATIDNLKEQTSYTQARKFTEYWKALNEEARLTKNKALGNVAERMAESQAQYLDQQLENAKTRGISLEAEAQQAPEYYKKRVEKVKADIYQSVQSGRLKSIEAITKKLDADLAKEGIRPGDPLYYRTFKQIKQWLNDENIGGFREGIFRWRRPYFR